MAISRSILKCFVTIALFLLPSAYTTEKKPHIVVMLADDMGWNDVSFHGSNQIPTPNIDALAYNGIILNNHYVQALCTPSRSAFMTGKYPIHNGMQHLVLLEPEPRGLPLTEKLMPEYLKEAGYSTYAIGKWHLGYYKKEYTPTFRGFDSHFGYWNGVQDYYTHNVHATFQPFVGYDMRRNMSVDYESRGKYSTNLFTDEAVKIIKEHNTENPMFMYLAHLAPHTGNQDNPLQAPDEEVAKFTHIKDPERRVYAAMVTMLDKSVGTVISALREKGMLENSIIIFMSDNGAQTEGIHANRGSNYPFRGLKGGPWEGGIKTVATVWSPLLNSTQRVSNQLMHVTDWLPTLYAAAGLNSSNLQPMDGVNMWRALSENLPSPRIEVVNNIDDIDNYASIRRGDWKYIIGTVLEGKQDGWFGDSGENSTFDYNVEEVLNSKAGVALSGVVTTKQLQEKRILRNVPDDHEYKKQYLTLDTIEYLRDEAMVKCPERDQDETNPKSICRPLESPCLFNIKEDPCEMVNLASVRPLVLLSLEESLLQYRKNIVPASNVPIDPKSNPIYWDNVWTTWQDKCHKCSGQKLSPTMLAVIITVSVLIVISLCTILLFVCKSRSPHRPSPRTNFSSIIKAFDLRTRTPQTNTNSGTFAAKDEFDEIEAKTNEVLRGVV